MRARDEHRRLPAEADDAGQVLHKLPHQKESDVAAGKEQ
jgi:hypothetical protein